MAMYSIQHHRHVHEKRETRRFNHSWWFVEVSRPPLANVEVRTSLQLFLFGTRDIF